MDRFESHTRPDTFANVPQPVADPAQEAVGLSGTMLENGADRVTPAAETAAQPDMVATTPAAALERRPSRLRTALTEAAIPLAVGATVIGYALTAPFMSRFDKPGAKEQGPDKRSDAQVGIDVANANVKRATEKYGADSPQARAAAANRDEIIVEGIAAGQDTTPSSDD